MRFAIATTALLLANCEASTDEKPANKRIIRIGSDDGAISKRMLLRGNTQPGNKKGPQQGQLRNPTAKRLFRQLANKKTERTMKLKNTKSEGNEALPLPDLGVIGSRNLQKTGKQSIMDKDSIRESSDVKIYDDTSSEYNSFLLTTLQDVCKEVSDGNVNCDCRNFDFESVNGTIECGFYSVSDSSDLCQSTINYCGEPVELCYRETIVLEASDPENYSYTTCATYTEPYQQHVCLTFEHTAGEKRSYEVDSNLTTVVDYGDGKVSYTNSSPSPCSVQFNDMECNSCSTAIRTFQQNFVNEATGESEIVGIVQDRCFQIDCSNTGDKTNIVDTCDGGDSLLPTTVGNNVVFGDDCTRCQPCGLGYRVQNLDAEGTFPVIGEYQCSGLELAAKIGFFDRKLCPQVQAATAKYCGCEPIFYDSSLAFFPAPETSRSDIGSTSYEPSVVFPGDTIGDSSCDVCGSQTAIVANPDAIVTLPKGIMTSCSAIQGLGRLGMFTSDYCRSEVMPLVFRTCGGCYHDQSVTPADPSDILDPSFQDFEDQQPSITEDISVEAKPKLTTTTAATMTTSTMGIVASRIDGENDQKSKARAADLHNEGPEELDVDSDGQGDDSDSVDSDGQGDDSDALVMNAATTDVSSAYSLRSKAWMMLAIPCYFVVYFS